MRYVGQGHEISISLPVEQYTREHGIVLRTAFEDAYQKLYGRFIEGVDIEVLSWTLTITAPVPEVDLTEHKVGQPTLPEPIATQSLFDPNSTERVMAPVYLREELLPGSHLEGPALITEDQTTTVVTRSYHADIDGRGYIVLTRRETS